MIRFSKEALGAMTNDQRDALIRMHHDGTRGIEVTKGGFGLPDDYLSFSQEYVGEGGTIYGGIDPEGRIST